MDISLVFAALVVGGYFAGRVARVLGLPGVLGMTLFGIALSVFMKPLVPPVFFLLLPFLKSLALVIILLRAGLGLSRKQLKTVGGPALRMSVIPCVLEAIGVTVLLTFLAGWWWIDAAMAGFVLAAVSPAVVVPSMLEFKEAGLGKAREVPTLVLAGASLDNVVAIALFSLFFDLAKSAGSASGDLGAKILAGLGFIPLSLIGGIIPGVILGLALVWFYHRYHGKIRATEKVLIFLGGALLLVQVGTWTHTAALLGVMTLGFILVERLPQVATELAQKLSKIWVAAEIILFTSLGLTMDLNTAASAGLVGIGIIAGGLLFRSAGVWLALLRTTLNRRERLFCMVSYLPKASVQAAIGGVALAAGLARGQEILVLAVLAIVLTTPLGVLAIRHFGPRWLEKGE